MGISSEAIERVRIYLLEGGVRADGSFNLTPRAALVRWHSNASDKFHQVYINGKFAGATYDCRQRQMIVHLPSSPSSAVRIEVFAVEPENAHIDFSSQIEPAMVDSGRVRLTLLRSQELAIDSVFNIYSDNGTGQINYEEPMNKWPVRIWPHWQDKAGFGMAEHGEGDFGWDSASAAGFGKGAFGWGQFSLDADVIEWMSEPLSTGKYLFGVETSNPQGQNITVSDQVIVTPAAQPAERLYVTSFDKQSNQLILTIGSVTEQN